MVSQYVLFEEAIINLTEFVDSRLRRSPPDRTSAVPYGQPGKTPRVSRGKRHAFPPPCPQVGGRSQASQHPATTQDDFEFEE